MTVSILSLQCQTELEVFGEVVPNEPDHDRCPGGQTIPGVMGGWICSCPCHRKLNA